MGPLIINYCFIIDEHNWKLIAFVNLIVTLIICPIEVLIIK